MLITTREYIDKLPEERKEPIKKIVDSIENNLPKGFEETFLYNMPSWVVPLKTYPKGYHVNTSTPLPFLSLASQKHYIALYHFGLYNDPILKDWFVSEYPKYSSKKLDMGKSCIRFKDMNTIPYPLLDQLFNKIDPEEWVKMYEKTLNLN